MFAAADQKPVGAGGGSPLIDQLIQPAEEHEGLLREADIHFVKILLRLLCIGGDFLVAFGKPFNGKKRFEHHARLSLGILLLLLRVKMIDVVAAEAGDGFQALRVFVGKVLHHHRAEGNAGKMCLPHVFPVQNGLDVIRHFVDIIALLNILRPAVTDEVRHNYAIFLRKRVHLRVELGMIGKRRVQEHDAFAVAFTADVIDDGRALRCFFDDPYACFFHDQFSSFMRWSRSVNQFT